MYCKLHEQDLASFDVEGLVTSSTGCAVRGLAKEYRLKGHTTDEMEWALEGLTADVTEYTAKGLLANETERAVMGINAAVTQCAAMKLTVDEME